MDIQRIPAERIDQATARQIAVLLGRAFTDERHTQVYSQEQRLTLLPEVERVHAAAPEPGELMPQGYMENFPTFRNLVRAADGRRDCDHILVRNGGYVASHVAMFAQHFRFEGLHATGGYIEDVATDPLHLGQGLASKAMRLAIERAGELGLDLLGLATGIQPFYRRLGWIDWEGGHTFQVVDFGLSYPDEPLMLFPLSAAGEAVARNRGQMLSWRLWRFGERPAG